MLEGLSVFFPCYNEEQNILPLVSRGLCTFPHLAKEFEIIVVDDGSTDRTAAVVKNMMRSEPRVRLVQHERNQGYGAALRSGFYAARLPWVFYTDGDGQFDLDEVAELIGRSSEADIISGYRIHRADPWHRKMNAAIFAFALHYAIGLRFQDVNCAYKLYRRSLFDRIHPRFNGALINAEIFLFATRQGFRINSVGVTHKPRMAGASTGNHPRVVLRAVWEFLKLLLTRWEIN